MGPGRGLFNCHRLRSQVALVGLSKWLHANLHASDVIMWCVAVDTFGAHPFGAVKTRPRLGCYVSSEQRTNSNI